MQRITHLSVWHDDIKCFFTLEASLKAKSSSYPYPVLKRINLNLQAAFIFTSQICFDDIYPALFVNPAGPGRS